MSNRLDTLDINCPKCNKSHKYKLEIHRSLVMYHSDVSTEAKKHEFTRIFICPNTNKKFQIRFAVTQRAGEVIHDVVPLSGQIEEAKTTNE